MNTTRYPVDFDTLKKGSVVTAETIEAYAQAKPETKAYNFAALSLCKDVETYLAQTGIYATVCIRANQIHVLTDEEAAEYNKAKYEQGRNRMFQAHRRNSAVDVSMLADDQRAQHERTLQRHAFELASLKQARNSLANAEKARRIEETPTQEATAATNQ
jgi:hypothetical protein